MNEQRISPRSSAFPRPPRDSALSPEATTAAESTAARTASVELAIHGDPSAGRTAPGITQDKAQEQHLRVDWVRPTDLAARAGASGMAHSAEWNMRAHQWLRTQPRRVMNASEDLARRLPPLSRFGRAPGTGLSAPAQSVPSR